MFPAPHSHKSQVNRVRPLKVSVLSEGTQACNNGGAALAHVMTGMGLDSLAPTCARKQAVSCCAEKRQGSRHGQEPWYFKSLTVFSITPDGVRTSWDPQSTRADGDRHSRNNTAQGGLRERCTFRIFQRKCTFPSFRRPSRTAEPQANGL